MNQQARQKYILEKIKLDGVVNSASIAQDLSVSLITVRRDLKILAAQGLIELTHGGAINNELNILEYPMAIKMDILLGEKKSIANYCMSLVKPNSSIYLDTGSTTLLVAKKLIHIEGCVFYTNSLLIMNSLSKINGI
ncbi:TPA: DeoR/GlpR transcriptional regulator, partial [Raoultella ornithinolytica]|nr:DeoR/GlpR transcriptional regulator [Raoultella ornithinolytica]